MKTSPKGILVASVATAVVIMIGLMLFSHGEKRITQRVTHLYAVADPPFLRSMGVLLGPALVEGNRVETLLNGDQIFPAMLAAISSAKQTITFETYIYWSGKTGQAFADALAERARSGVKVHILLDWVGSQKMEAAYLTGMREAGVEIEKYHQPRWYALNKLNNRTHRKLLVIDGSIGFTGGVGIADDWLGNAQDPTHWRDTHYRIEGPVVAQMQAAFTDNWTKVSGAVLHGDQYFPRLKSVGSNSGQMFKSSIEGGSESTHLMYLLSIAAAKTSIRLSMAYFVPDKLARETITAALKRGVKVQIILPGKYIDSTLVRSASRATWGEMLQAGAEIYEYQPTMFHCKVLVVDDLWVSVGSTNFDSRSFRLNDEANLNIYNREFAERQTAEFARDLKRSRRITYEEWEQRPLQEKAWEHVLALIGTQL